jgi:UDP-GlcNAc:undecaprenyl-phosphate/decaprenyl-phosphate GlcNAc-1-phosphate transferase
MRAGLVMRDTRNCPPADAPTHPNPTPATVSANTPAIRLYIIGFATALVSALVLTYVVRERARHAGLFDPVDARKVHTRQIPRVGGIAVFLAVALSLTIVGLHPATTALDLYGAHLFVVLVGGMLIHLIGVWDDLRGLPARWKLAAQVAIAVGMYAAGVRVSAFSLPFAGTVELGPVVGLLFTLLWFVGITNAFNLIDGLDGLASGAALFALTTMFVVASINGQAGSAVLTIVLAGATLGFLVYNFHPASIFLGDSGSLFIGFMLAGVGALSSQKSQTVVAVAIPVVALGLPVLDTALAIVRRFLRGQPIFSADRGHIHHRLLGLGHSPRTVALLLYAVCAILALGGMLLVNDSAYSAIVLLLVGAGVGLLIQRLRYYEFEELARLFRKGLRQREVIGRNVRIREASAGLLGLDDMDDVFSGLAQVFAHENVLRAEVRVRWSYVNYDPIAVALDARVDDDMKVWSWCTGPIVSPNWWEIILPLMHPNGDRVGSLVIWQDGTASENSLSHVPTIARELRRVVQEKLITLWPSATYAARALTPPAEPVPVRAPMERAVPVVTVAEPARTASTVADTDARAAREPARRSDGASGRRTTAA